MISWDTKQNYWPLQCSKRVLKIFFCTLFAHYQNKNEFFDFCVLFYWFILEFLHFWTDLFGIASIRKKYSWLFFILIRWYRDFFCRDGNDKKSVRRFMSKKILRIVFWPPCFGKVICPVLNILRLWNILSMISDKLWLIRDNCNKKS